jgi:hypothetical protein
LQAPTDIGARGEEASCHIDEEAAAGGVAAEEEEAARDGVDEEEEDAFEALLRGAIRAPLDPLATVLAAAGIHGLLGSTGAFELRTCLFCATSTGGGNGNGIGAGGNSSVTRITR